MKKQRDEIPKLKLPLFFGLYLMFAMSLATPGQDARLAWLGEFMAFSELPILQPAFSNYSEQDLELFRERLEAIRSTKPKNEWEGRYVPGTVDVLGFNLMDISFNAGFASLYLYTCIPELRSIDYGSVVERTDIIELVSEAPAGSPRKMSQKRFVKVRWGDRLFLVDELYLDKWAEKAAGVFIAGEGSEHPWSNYWEKGDLASELQGEPEFPNRYQHLKRAPIRTSITRVASRKIAKDISLGNSYYTAEVALYSVTVGAGQNSGVKKGMVFRLLNSKDEVFITKVSSRSASGLIVRAINKRTLADHCLSETTSPLPIRCPEIKVGEPISTIVGNFWL